MSLVLKSESLRTRLPSISIIVACVLASILLAGVLVLAHYWPFRESVIRSHLADALSAKVHFGRFRTRYFPPGCIAEDVRFERTNPAGATMTVQRLTVTSSLIGLIKRHVSLIHAQGIQLSLTWQDFSQPLGNGRHIPIDQLLAEDAVVEIAWTPSRSPQRFLFHNLKLEGLIEGRRLRFRAALENPLPKGLLRTWGEIGPWNGADRGDTRLSGQYSLENADLAGFQFLGGTVFSSGRFQGQIRNIEIEGSIHSPRFEVASTAHALPLDSQFHASVDTSTADVVLDRVTAQFGHDQLEGHGTIARGADHKRVAIAEIECRRGRIEDTFYPFIHSPRSPLSGNTQFTMRIRIPGGSERFLERVKFESDFRIEGAHFTHAKTAAEVQKLSTKQEDGEQPQTTATFWGQVAVSGGRAHFSELAVQDSGAFVHFRGTYGLISERVDLHGQLNTEKSLSKSTHGIKAVFAKVLEPFFKKRPQQYQVPVKIGGTYKHPSFGLDL